MNYKPSCMQLEFDSLNSFYEGLLRDYNRTIGLPDNYSFGNNRPILPIVPKDTTTNSVMFIGAYPTAKFVHGRIPEDNIERPFAVTTKSGKELKGLYLNKLDLKREDCWITNLVKVFLFKTGHNDGAKTNPSFPTRGDFETIGSHENNLVWLDWELRFASPKIVITLGREVAGILRRVQGNKKRNELLAGNRQAFDLFNCTYNAIHLAHPGILMRKKDPHNPWPDKHEEHCREAKQVINATLQKNK